MKKTPDQVAKDLHEMLEEYARKNDVTLSCMLAFLTTSFVGTLEMHGYDEEFFDKTCLRMKEEFKKKRLKRLSRIGVRDTDGNEGFSQ